MARVEISFFVAGNRSKEGGTMPVARAGGMRTEVLTSGSSSVATTLGSDAAEDTGFVRILADADIWVVAGATPVAAFPTSGQSLPGLRVKAGVPTDLAVAKGDRIAVLTVV